MSENDGPVIVVDVDGVINPWNPYYSGYARLKFRISTGEMVKVALNHNHGQMLLDLAETTGSELMWATFWNQDANKYIGPRIGLPEMPVIPISDELFYMPHSKRPSHGAWKVEQVAKSGVLKNRTFVWFDDEPDVAELVAKDGRFSRSHLVVPVQRERGLNAADVAQAEQWLLATAVPV